VGLTGENVQYIAANPLDRRESYDSRLKEGSVDYLRDGFIVDDSLEDEVTTVGSEITIARTDESSSESDSDATMTPKRKRKLIVRTPVRKVSEVSVAPSGSGLCVTDDEEIHSIPLLPITKVTYKAVDLDIEPADVAEEITDAICRFSRRCNHLCPPLRLELTSSFIEDEVVAEAMACGMKQSGGKCVKTDDGRVLYIVGPSS
jgi:hypothetical protein